MKSDYVYKEPVGEKHIVSIREWNKTFAKRGRWPFVRVEVFLRDDEADCHYVVSLVGKAVIIIVAPLFYMIGTFIEGFNGAHKSVVRVLRDKHLGAFTSDRVYAGTKDWEKLMKLIGRE
jgi:hypothetical protein